MLRSARVIALALFTTSLGCCFLARTASAAEVTVTSRAGNVISARVSDGPNVHASGEDAQAIEASGITDSECRAYGRRGTASASSDVTFPEQTSSSAYIDMRTSVSAAGGHYRTCAVCGPGPTCIGIEGHDLDAFSSAAASSRTKIEFSADLVTRPYSIQVSPSGTTEKLRLRLLSPDGSAVEVDPNRASKLTINPKPLDVYYLEGTLTAGAANSGGCCESSEADAASFKVSVTPAAILESDSDALPFIIGGQPVDDGLFDQVVAILLDGELHCSGTLIGPKTILTAAHCVAGYEQAITNGRFEIFVGNSIFVDGQRNPIVGYDFPRDPAGLMYRRDDHSISHDIGILYLAEKSQMTPVALHNDVPTWDDIESIEGSELTFVGFGLKVIKQGKGTGKGVKREATWRFENRDVYNFYFKGQSSNTCKGDSGGPAFIRVGATGDLFLVGITSSGNSSCTSGIEMRVDAHFAWITSRVQ